MTKPETQPMEHEKDTNNSESFTEKARTTCTIEEAFEITLKFYKELQAEREQLAKELEELKAENERLFKVNLEVITESPVYHLSKQLESENSRLRAALDKCREQRDNIRYYEPDDFDGYNAELDKILKGE